MNIVTWNVNSIRSREPYVRAFLTETEPDVICIQELKATNEQVSEQTPFFNPIDAPEKYTNE